MILKQFTVNTTLENTLLDASSTKNLGNTSLDANTTPLDANTLNIETNLWKLIHYKTINHYRSLLKLSTSKTKIISSQLRVFLSDASSFYLSLIQQLMHLYQIESSLITSHLNFVFLPDTCILISQQAQTMKYITSQIIKNKKY